MQVIRSLDEIPYNRNTVVTVGTFDGVHIGHQKIISELINRAQTRNGRSVLITFDPHPKEIVGRGPAKLLTTIDERLNIFSKSNIDIIVIINFTFEFSRLPYNQFIKNYIFDKMGVSEIIVGYDHMFGRDREANINQLIDIGKQLGFEVDSIPPITVDGEVVSSSKIRNFIMQGDVCSAKKYLGKPYSLEGKVITGDKRGKMIGFPTANIQPLSVNKLIPADGVYSVGVNIGNEKYFGMLNIGYRPTFTDNKEKKLEVHLFNFEKNIYNETIILNYYKRIRSEIKFSAQDKLITQLKLDEEKCKEFKNE